MSAGPSISRPDARLGNSPGDGCFSDLLLCYFSNHQPHQHPQAEGFHTLRINHLHCTHTSSENSMGHSSLQQTQAPKASVTNSEDNPPGGVYCSRNKRTQPTRSLSIPDPTRPGLHHHRPTELHAACRSAGPQPRPRNASLGDSSPLKRNKPGRPVDRPTRTEPLCHLRISAPS